MEGLAIGLMTIGFLGFLVSLIMLVVTLVRKKKKKPWILSFIVFTVLLFIGAGLGGITGESGKKVEKPPAGVKAEKPVQKKAKEEVSQTKSSVKSGLVMVDFNWKIGEFGNRSLVGTVKNNSGKQYSYVQVEFNLYDESGAQVGSTFTNVNNLEPYGTWKFEAVVIEDKATRAKFKGITGF